MGPRHCNMYRGARHVQNSIVPRQALRKRWRSSNANGKDRQCALGAHRRSQNLTLPPSPPVTSRCSLPHAKCRSRTGILCAPAISPTCRRVERRSKVMSRHCCSPASKQPCTANSLTGRAPAWCLCELSGRAWQRPQQALRSLTSAGTGPAPTFVMLLRSHSWMLAPAAAQAVPALVAGMAARQHCCRSSVRPWPAGADTVCITSARAKDVRCWRPVCCGLRG